MVHHLVADNARGRFWPVLVDVVAKVSQAGVPARDQHFGNAIQCITNLAKELVFGAHTAVMLACELEVLVQLLLDHLFAPELQHGLACCCHLRLILRKVKEKDSERAALSLCGF
jgi:hypothetical protein